MSKETTKLLLLSKKVLVSKITALQLQASELTAKRLDELKKHEDCIKYSQEALDEYAEKTTRAITKIINEFSLERKKLRKEINEEIDRSDTLKMQRDDLATLIKGINTLTR